MRVEFYPVVKQLFRTYYPCTFDEVHEFQFSEKLDHPHMRAIRKLCDAVYG